MPASGSPVEAFLPPGQGGLEQREYPVVTLSSHGCHPEQRIHVKAASRFDGTTSDFVGRKALRGDLDFTVIGVVGVFALDGSR